MGIIVYSFLWVMLRIYTINRIIAYQTYRPLLRAQILWSPKTTKTSFPKPLQLEVLAVGDYTIISIYIYINAHTHTRTRIYPLIYLSIDLSTCLFIYPSICLSIYPSIYLPTYLSLSLSLRMYVCVYIYIYIYVGCND